MVSEADKRSAFLCDTGERHQWVYLRDLSHNYRCSLCLVVMAKGRMKELTDNA